jgi:hypothetical protein
MGVQGIEVGGYIGKCLEGLGFNNILYHSRGFKVLRVCFDHLIAFLPGTESGLFTPRPVSALYRRMRYVSVVSQYMVYNCVYYCDTYLFASSQFPNSLRDVCVGPRFWGL